MLPETPLNLFAEHPISTPKCEFYQGNHCVTFKNFRVFSAFQPIFSIGHRRVVGVEGLARAVDAEDKSVSPWQLFNTAAPEERDELDLLCQSIHVDNFFALGISNIWLFLNVSPETLNNYRYFSNHLLELIRARDLKPENVVIEVLENDISSEQDLETAITHYKELGFLIAIDDFGAGHSNFHRIWRLQPDIVKFDRSMVQRAGGDSSVQTMMKGIVDLLHTNKCIVLAEGVETLGEALACVDAHVDLVQGFYFCRPTPISSRPDYTKQIWPTIYSAFDIYSNNVRHQHLARLSPYRGRFASIVHLLSLKAKKLKLDTSIQDCADSMFELDNVIRVYVIDEYGHQNIANIVSPKFQSIIQSQLTPLANTEGATWRHRPYFYRALEERGEVQVTRPYFSIPDASLCITLSLCIEHDNSASVICCDIAWDE